MENSVAVNFISCKDNDKERVMHSKRDNKETMTKDKAYKVIKKLFESLLNRYQSNLEKPRKGSDLITFIYCILNIIK